MKNRINVNVLINRMFVYSAIKIIAKVPDLYSVLNPETNSDSPSAKSKGVRLVSARAVAIHINRSIGSMKISGRILFEKFIMLKDLIINKGDIIIRAILTS